MKGQFSIEWLSQSSSGVRDVQQTSSTSTESLPGSYSRWRTDNQEEEEKHREQNIIIHTHESGFSSSTEEEETSGYESEGSRSLSPRAPKEAAPPSVSPSTGRRPRTAFTAEQISSLERVFKRSAYLGAQDKAELCKTLNLTDKQIRNWFQNRRMKLKRTVQDSLAQACQAKVASHMMHYSDLHSFRAAPYPSFYPAVQESPAAYGPAYHYSPAAAGAMPVEPLFQYSSYQNLHHCQYYSTH